MHIFHAYIPGLLRCYRNLAKYSQQPAEKLNDFVKHVRMQGKNKNDETYKQIMKHFLLLFVLENLVMDYKCNQTHVCQIWLQAWHKLGSKNVLAMEVPFDLPSYMGFVISCYCIVNLYVLILIFCGYNVFCTIHIYNFLLFGNFVTTFTIAFTNVLIN